MKALHRPKGSSEAVALGGRDKACRESGEGCGGGGTLGDRVEAVPVEASSKPAPTMRQLP